MRIAKIKEAFPLNNETKKPNQDKIYSRSELLSMLLNTWKIERKTETVQIKDSIGRICAEDVFAKYNSPQFRVSGLDGIAVSSEDFKNGFPDTSSWQLGKEFVRADTGDDFPDEFDSVIAIEDISMENGKLKINDGYEFQKGSNTRPAGDNCKEGELLVKANEKIDAMKGALLVAGGLRQVNVIKKPKVVYIPTGDELIYSGDVPKRGDTFESNSIMISALLSEMGAETVSFPIIKDNKSHLEEALNEALLAGDIVIINGGSSKGSEDYNAKLLQERSNGFFTHYVKAGPGRPIAMSLIDGKPVINVPGPTISCFVGIDWCIKGLVEAYYGVKSKKRPTITATLADDLKKKKDFEMYYWFDIEKSSNGEYIAHLVSRKETLPYFVRNAKALFIGSLDRGAYEKGEKVELQLLCGIEEL